MLDANLKLDRIDTAGGSHDAEIACAVLTLVDDFHLYRRVGRPSQLGQNIGEREAFERRVVKFSDEIARRHAGLGCRAARVRPVDPQALLLHGDERLDSKPSGFATGQALPVTRTHGGAEVIGPDMIGERSGAQNRRHCRRDERGRLGNRQCAIGQMIDRRELQRFARFAGRRLDHLQADQFLRRINPEIRAPFSSPGKASDRSRHPAGDRIGADGEAKPKVCSGKGSNVVSEDANTGRQRVRRHLLHRLRGEQVHAIEFAVIQKHLAKAEIVGRG